MSNTLCKLKELLPPESTAFRRLMEDPSHFCKKCGRIANRKKRLCKPKKLRAIE